MSLYTTASLAEEAGASMRQIDYWTNLGLLRPVQVKGSAPRGSGNRRIYDDLELAVAQGLVVFTKPVSELGEGVRRATLNGEAYISHGFRIRWGRP